MSRIIRPSKTVPNRGRRNLLRGIGGVTLALPFLEYFMPRRAYAAPPPQRYAFMFAGFSIGSNPTGKLAPKVTGPTVDNITPGLAPLETFGTADVTSVISGLEIPVGEPIPVAGRPASFHSSSHQVLSTGTQYSGTSLPAPSSDWIVANAIAAGTAEPVLTYRAQPSYYRVDSEGSYDGIISARLNGAGELEQVPPLTSPRVAFESLFSGFVPPDPEEGGVVTAQLAMRRSVVDLVADDAEALHKRLGKADQIRMQRHLDELRSLEKRLDATDLPMGEGCQLLRHPGDDPPIGDAIDPTNSDYNANYENANGYSDEELRAEIMTDLIHMAFACDISRVASFMLTHAQCFMNMYPALGLASDLHEITHGSIGQSEEEMQDALAACAAWNLRHFARLTDKLRNTLDSDGSSVLDNTALAFAFEGGWGFDLETGLAFSPHSTQNMVMLVAGGAGGLNASGGRHIVAQGRHPSAVLNSCMQAVGVEETLGDVPDRVEELFG